MPAFGKSAPLREASLSEFLAFYGNQSDGSDRSAHPTKTAGGRFRAFTREELSERDNDLDILWLREAGDSPEDDLTDPAAITHAISEHLRLAMAALREIADELEAGGAARRGS